MLLLKSLLLISSFTNGQISWREPSILFGIDREYLDRSSIVTTADDDAFSPPPLFQQQMMDDSIMLNHNNKREVILLRNGAQIDFGPNVSRVLAHIRRQGAYDKRIRPNYNGKPVIVGVSMFISGISHISEANMDVTLDFYFRQFWQDHRLGFAGIWNEELVLGGEFMQEMWRPDTFFVNAKLSSFHHVTMLNTFIRVSPSGSVIQSIRLTVTASCPMNFTYFPMDSQRCALEIESFGYTTRDINYTWANIGKPSVGFAPEVHKLPQFRIRGHLEAYKEERLSTGNYSRLVLSIYLERSLGYYIIQVYVPSALIVCLSQISFWISRESPPARVSLGITTVLTMQTLISSTNAALPKISYLKALDVYLVFCFVMVFSALLEYAAVSYTGKRCRMVQTAKTERKPVYTQLRQALADDDFCPPFGRVTDENDDDKDDEDRETELCTVKCCACCQRLMSKASDIEKYSRVIFPTVFFCFNIIYWILYLNISVRLNEDGFIECH